MTGGIALFGRGVGGSTQENTGKATSLDYAVTLERTVEHVISEMRQKEVNCAGNV